MQADRLVAVPDGVDMAGATALLHDGATALGLARHTGIQPTDWVLVLSASGLGLLLLQIAQASGAQVIGAAGARRSLTSSSAVAPRRSWITATGTGPPR